MQVQVINMRGDVVDPLGGLKTKTAELVEYTNKISGKPDPMICYEKGRFAHMSSLLKGGFRVINAATKEPVVIANLSPA
jgi:hypothetical protein